MDRDQELRTRSSVSLKFRALFVGTLELILGACLLAFHVLNLIKIIETRELLGAFSTFLPDDENRSHQAYHIAASVLASFMIGFTFVLFWGMYNYKDDLIWAWILANSMLCMIYGFLGIYGLMLRYLWFTLENVVIIGCIIIFIAAVCPYYKWMVVRNDQCGRVIQRR